MASSAGSASAVLERWLSQHWAGAELARRWQSMGLPEWLASSPVWTPVAMVSLAVVVMAFWLLRALQDQEEEESDGKIVWHRAPRSVSVPKPPRQKRHCMLFCCMGREDDRGDQAPAGEHGVPWAQQDTTHPKWCGLRHREPSEELPGCQAFAPERFQAPDAWEGQLGQTAAEQQGCAELRESLVLELGPKDPITILRYLRARQGNVARAKEMYKASMRWRKADNDLVDKFRSGALDDTIHKKVDQYWKPLGVLGFDRDGDPILWERLGRCHIPTMNRLPARFLEIHQVYMNVRIQQTLDELMRQEACRVWSAVVQEGRGIEGARNGWDFQRRGVMQGV